jgi:DNA replication and repair protein RecF
VAELRRLWLQQFRNYVELDVTFEPGRVVIAGRNGQGKSNLLEAIGYLGALGSFRGVPNEALITQGTDTAIIRGEAESGTRGLLIEIELNRSRPNRVQVNKQRLSPVGELVGMLPMTVFGPDDLDLVKDGPALRRRYLDDLLVQLHPRNERLRSELDRVLRQRNALLRQARGRWNNEIDATLSVWNTKLAEVGEAWASARAELVDRLAPEADAAYEELAGAPHRVAMRYEPEWRASGLLVSLERARDDELRRGVTLVGPHRDELEISLSAMPARTQASQGEQRTLALALRIAGHHVVGMTRGTSPLLLLDDVFSELDPQRASALLGLLVAEQTFVTTAGAIPMFEGEVQQFVVEAGAVRRI